VLDQVAPVDGGWGDTAALNINSSGRRVPDRTDLPVGITDQVWTGDVVNVSATALFWGGKDYPADATWRGNPSQNVVWTTSLDGHDPINTGVNIDNPLGTFDIGEPGADGSHEFLLGVLRAGSVKAWSLEELNSPWGSGENDRVVTFDVAGLDVYMWDYGSNPAVGNGKTLIRSADEEGTAYILGIDPGSDGDFQDTVVLVEGPHLPEPSVVAMVFGGGGGGDLPQEVGRTPPALTAEAEQKPTSVEYPADGDGSSLTVAADEAVTGPPRAQGPTRRTRPSQFSKGDIPAEVAKWNLANGAFNFYSVFTPFQAGCDVS
jgi:hypothetical protein